MRSWICGVMAMTLLGLSAVDVQAQTAKPAYLLSAHIQRGPAWCGDTHSGPEYYVVVTRADPAIRKQVKAVERKTKKVVGYGKMSSALGKLRTLAKRESRSRARPLSFAEEDMLTKLRAARKPFYDAARRARRAQGTVLDDAQWMALMGKLDAGLLALEVFHGKTGAEQLKSNARSFPYRRTVKRFESREALSETEFRMLREGQDLVKEWRRLRSLLRMRSSPGRPATLRVYPDDDLVVVLWEDDAMEDDRCYSTVVKLDRETLEKGFFEVADTAMEDGQVGRRVFVRLRWVPAP